MDSCAYHGSCMYTKLLCDVLTVKSCHKCFAKSGLFLKMSIPYLWFQLLDNYQQRLLFDL